MSVATAFPQQAAKTPYAEQDWPPQGKWTYEDYRSLPDDGWRYEVIEGELFMSPAPEPMHQESGGNLFASFREFGKKNDAGKAYSAPIDVMLGNFATPVQPDICFIIKSRLDIVKKKRIEGAPDIIVEILSPSNWLVDRRTKYELYAKAGVREYWIVDPEARTIELFVLNEERYELRGKFGVGETVRCEVLSDFEVKVEDICPAF